MTVESLYIRTELGIMSNNSKASAVPTALKSGVNLAIKMRFWRSQRRPKKAVCSLFVSATPGQWSRGLSSQGPFGAGLNKPNERTRLPRGVAVSLRLAVMVIESINTRAYEWEQVERLRTVYSVRYY